MDIFVKCTYHSIIWSGSPTQSTCRFRWSVQRKQFMTIYGGDVYRALTARALHQVNKGLSNLFTRVHIFICKKIIGLLAANHWWLENNFYGCFKALVYIWFPKFLLFVLVRSFIMPSFMSLMWMVFLYPSQFFLGDQINYVVGQHESNDNMPHLSKTSMFCFGTYCMNHLLSNTNCIYFNRPGTWQCESFVEKYVS